MLHIGRCGSTVLANMLNQHPQVHWDGKIHRKARQLYGDKLRALDHVEWTRHQFLISGSRYYGYEFKILADQYPSILGTTTRDFLSACKTIGVTHYILLRRRNTLRHVISHYASKSRGNWHISADEEVHAQRFTIDCDSITTGSAPGRSLVDYLEEVEAIHQEVRDVLQGERLLEMEYESDIDTPGAKAAFEKVCGFLNIPAVAAVVMNKKINPFALDQTVENYSELADRLAGTPYEWMLEPE